MTDSCGQVVKCYPEVPEILSILKGLGYSLGIASRFVFTQNMFIPVLINHSLSSEPKPSKKQNNGRWRSVTSLEQLLKLFQWNQYFDYKQIFAGCKVTHFNNIKKESGLPFNQMIFFDDENRNIRDLSAKGVVSILVERGVTKKVVNDGIKRFVEQNK